jgi:6-phosphofructokinase 1
MRRVAVLTRDCAGVNACVRAVVRKACTYDIEVQGVLRGYEGLIEGKLKALDRRSVSGIMNLGGTVLKTARSERFLTEKGQLKAMQTIKKKDIDGLIIIGGDGSLRGAHLLASKYGVNVVGIAATIDNDINRVNPSIGADTAANVALDALDKIRDTATSLERIFIVEVMGRQSGWMALQVALAGGCEDVLLPEREFNITRMCEEIEKGRVEGKASWIIIVAEGRARAQSIAEEITETIGLETRIAVLGHIQRGGRPTRIDRVMASQLGSLSVDLMKRGESDVCVGFNDGKKVVVPLSVATKPKLIEVEEYYKLIKILT